MCPPRSAPNCLGQKPLSLSRCHPSTLGEGRALGGLRDLVGGAWGAVPSGEAGLIRGGWEVFGVARGGDLFCPLKVPVPKGSGCAGPACGQLPITRPLFWVSFASVTPWDPSTLPHSAACT